MPLIILLILASLLQAQDDFGTQYQTLIADLNKSSFEERAQTHQKILKLSTSAPKTAVKHLLKTTTDNPNPETRSRATSILRELYNTEFIPPAKGYLGIRHGQTQLPLNGKPVNGAVVLTVMPNTPAAKAGLQQGDIIIKIGDLDLTTTPIDKMRDTVSQTIKAKNAGQKIQLTIARKGKTLVLEPTLAPYVDEFAEPEDHDKKFQRWLKSLREAQ